MEEARTDDSFGDIDAWTCPSESVVGGGSLARSRTSPAMVALLLFFFRWVNSTSPSHYWRNALNISSSFLFILTVIYIQYLRTDMKLRHGNFRRWRSESFRISNLPPQMKKVSIGRRYYKPQKILPLWWKRTKFTEKCASGQCLALAAAQAVLEFCMPRRLIDKWFRGT